MAFYIRVYAYAMIVHTLADQLISHIFIKQFDTLPSHCRNFVNVHEEFSVNNFLTK